MADGDVKTFSIIRKGYDPEEVDEYIDELESKLSYYRARNAELDQKLETARRLIKRFSASENDLRQNIADSKRAAAVMISETKDRCDTLLDKTRESCGEIISDLDMRVAEKMNTVDVMKASVAAFKDELFNLYSSHIELIESLAKSAEEFTYEPDYTPVSDAVEDFEAPGDPHADAPVFEDYPEESIFEEAKTEAEKSESFVLNEAKAPAREEEESFTAPADREKAAQTAEDSSEDSMFVFDTGANADEEESEQEPEFETGDGFDNIFDDIDEISRAQSEAIAAAAAEQDAGETSYGGIPYTIAEETEDAEEDSDDGTADDDEPDDAEFTSDELSADENDADSDADEYVEEDEADLADVTDEVDEESEADFEDTNAHITDAEEFDPADRDDSDTPEISDDTRADEDYFKFLSDFANGDDGN